ncbi:MAG: MFS transporter [Marinobacter sp.]
MSTESARSAAGAGKAFLLACGAVYVSQTLVTTMATQSMPALMRESGLPLQIVGLSYLFYLPWVLKFLWSPAIERTRHPLSGRDRSVALIVSGQCLLAVILLLPVLLWHGGSSFPVLIGVLLLAAALVSASVDIATDGVLIDALRAEARFERGNLMQVGGSYVGVLFGGGGFLLVAGSIGWPWALLLVSMLVVLTSTPLLFVHRPKIPSMRSRERPSLRQALARREIRQGLMIVLLLGAGIRMAFGMLGPVLLDHGVELSELGWLFGGFGAIAGLFGTTIGGMLAQRLPGWRSVTVVLALQTIALGAFIPVLALGTTANLLIGLCGVVFSAMAAGFVVIYSALMQLTSPAQPGVDFTLFQCADAAIAMTGGVAGGFLAQHFGYLVCFGLAGSLALMATLVLVGLNATGQAPIRPHEPVSEVV